MQQSCPPPIPECQEEPIDGFCCPRYECPIKTESFSIPDFQSPTLADILLGQVNNFAGLSTIRMHANYKSFKKVHYV